ncbi:MAG: bifunctional [glutamate--ammonia ligase]-adenylyl-L-tyrosine phosphorylase/[glutamate--ammonia-ligase] adenylyltransferase [Steroidobacteraceae bacterium]
MLPELELTELPASMRATVQQHLSAASERDGELWRTLLADERIARSLPHVWGCSDFVAQLCLRKPGYLAELLQSGRLHSALDPDALATELAHLPQEAPDTEVMRVLRETRQREMMRIAWRDLSGWAGIDETLRDQSHLADVCIRFAYERAYAQLAARFGTPLRGDGSRQSLVIIAMGKLGAHELNFSSDVDLVLLYPEDGEAAGERGIEHAEFFLRVAQKMVPWLTARSADGFVYRVDLRLRPFGDSGPLALSFAAFEHYLQQHGRDWERYAYVKARPITGLDAFRELYDEVLRPFVYRRYLDYSVFGSLRHMKSLIAREVERRELQDNIKLGPGGIREIEFIVQAFQLLRGGSDRRLQRRELNVVLPQLVGQRLLTKECVSDLSAAYRFLRRLENRLQEWADEQTHALPAEAAARERLAVAMEMPGWEVLAEHIELHRGRVAAHFAQTVFGPTSSSTEANGVLESVFDVDAGSGVRKQALQGIGVAAADAILARIDELKLSAYYRKLDETGMRRLSELMPRLLPALANVADPVLTFHRLTRILEMIGGRTVYLALLNENPSVLARLVEVCSRSQFLADQIAAHPLLLDELIDERLFEDLPSRASFAAELAMRREAVHGEDDERQVQMLREFQRAAVFRVALADITGRLQLMKVSDRLTDIAELIVREALGIAWTQLTYKHGVPQVTNERGEQRPAGMVVVAYGKFGGIELSYSSDLDLVFLYEADSERRTDGPNPIEPTVFFQRLAQRLMHLLSTHSAAGRLYEVDTRLRPGGNRGLLAQTLAGFEHYQRHEAWTWEHQSLLRSRAVAGAEALCARFEALRVALLQGAVKRDTLRDEVRKMRERMRAELSKAKAGEFDMKQDAGGIADLEFLTQYWVLYWADRHPELVTFSDNIRQLESLASGALLPQELVDFLTATYRKYRERLHHAALAGNGGTVPATEFVEERARLSEIWRGTMEGEGSTG